MTDVLSEKATFITITNFTSSSATFAYKKLKKSFQKVAQKYSITSLLPWAAQTSQTEEFMFQNMAYYRPTVYKTGFFTSSSATASPAAFSQRKSPSVIDSAKAGHTTTFISSNRMVEVRKFLRKMEVLFDFPRRFFLLLWRWAVGTIDKHLELLIRPLFLLLFPIWTLFWNK